MKEMRFIQTTRAINNFMLLVSNSLPAIRVLGKPIFKQTRPGDCLLFQYSCSPRCPQFPKPPNFVDDGNEYSTWLAF